MATKTLARYDDPNATIRREATQITLAGNAAIKYFRHYQAIRLKAIHFAVAVAGTATVHSLVAKLGTTALGTTTFGTSTQGVTATMLVGTGNTPTGISATAMEEFSLLNAADIVGTVDVSWEFEVLPGATVTK